MLLSGADRVTLHDRKYKKRRLYSTVGVVGSVTAFINLWYRVVEMKLAPRIESATLAC